MLPACTAWALARPLSGSVPIFPYADGSGDLGDWDTSLAGWTVLAACAVVLLAAALTDARRWLTGPNGAGANPVGVEPSKVDTGGYIASEGAEVRIMGKGTFILGLGVGYVFGTRAGRERYEQIKEHATGVWNSPRVQRKVDAAEQTAKSAADTATQKIGERLPGGSSNASEPASREPASTR